MPYTARYTYSLNDLLERATLGTSFPGVVGALVPIGLTYFGIPGDSPLFFGLCFGVLAALVLLYYLRVQRVKRSIPENHFEIERGVFRLFAEGEFVVECDLTDLNPSLKYEYARTAKSWFTKIPYFNLSVNSGLLGRQNLYFLVDGEYHLKKTKELFGDCVVESSFAL